MQHLFPYLDISNVSGKADLRGNYRYTEIKQKIDKILCVIKD